MPPALYNCTKCIIVVFRYFTSDGRSRAILSFFPFCQTSVEVFYLLADAERGSRPGNGSWRHPVTELWPSSLMCNLGAVHTLLVQPAGPPACARRVLRAEG